MASPAVSIGPMAATDLDTTLRWAAAEGWNPGLSDAQCFRAADPAGFIAARLNGRMVGSISSVRYGEAFGFIGLFIVEPGLRGQGIGTALWRAAMERQSGRCVGLDGVVAMQDAYAASGFVLAHRNLRFGGTLAAAPAEPEHELAVLGPADLGAVSAFDQPCFGGPRPDFLRAWLTQPGACTVAVRNGTSLKAMATIRPGQEGYRLGGLMVDDPDHVMSVLAGLRAHVGPQARVYWDIPEPNRAAVEMATCLGMDVAFETARMYVGGDPALPLARVFGITTFELG